MKVYAICTMLFLVVADSSAQQGVQAIRDAMDASIRRLDKQINWGLLRKECSFDSAWTMHIPVVDIARPQTKEEFMDGRFEDWLVPMHYPKRFLRRSMVRNESIIFNEKNDVIGQMSLCLTVKRCNTKEILMHDIHKLYTVINDSVPSDILRIGWRTVSGYIYKVSDRWYIITSDAGIVRNEPLSVLLKEQWEELRKGERFGTGTWDDAR